MQQSLQESEFLDAMPSPFVGDSAKEKRGEDDYFVGVEGVRGVVSDSLCKLPKGT